MYTIKSAFNDGVKNNNILLSTKTCVKVNKVLYCSNHHSSNQPSLMSTIDKHLSERVSVKKPTAKQEVDQIKISNNIKVIISKIKESKYINTKVRNYNGGENTECMTKNIDLSNVEIDFSDALINRDKNVDYIIPLQQEIPISKNISTSREDFKVIEDLN